MAVVAFTEDTKCDRNHSPKYERDELRYASDLTSAEWNLIAPYPGVAKSQPTPGRGLRSDHRKRRGMALPRQRSTPDPQVLART